MFFQNDGQPLEKLRATFFETMGNVFRNDGQCFSKQWATFQRVGLRHSLMALLHGVVASAQAATGLLHGVVRSAQARDGFTTRCSKERASPRRVYYTV